MLHVWDFDQEWPHGHVLILSHISAPILARANSNPPWRTVQSQLKPHEPEGRMARLCQADWETFGPLSEVWLQDLTALTRRTR